MNDCYYVFNQGRKRGPFSLDDLLDETEQGRIQYENFCLRIGATTCEKVREVLDWEDKHLILTPEFQEDLELGEHDEVEDDASLGDEDPCEGSDDTLEEEASENEDEEERDYDELQAEDEDEDEDDGFEDFEEAEEFEEYDETSPTPQSRPPKDSTTILYSGRPSLLSFPKSLLLVALSLGVGIWLRGQFEWILLAGISLALITFIIAQFRRARHRYFITPKQVEVIHGLILQNSREIRIEDIGAIHIRQRGLQGLLGLTSIEFAAVESPMPILVFYNVRSARRIKDLVRRLQDALENPD